MRSLSLSLLLLALVAIAHASTPSEGSEHTVPTTTGGHLQPAIINKPNKCGCLPGTCDCTEYQEPELFGDGRTHVAPEIIERKDDGCGKPLCGDQGVTILKAAGKEGEHATVLKPNFVELEADAPCGCCDEDECSCCPKEKKEYTTPELTDRVTNHPRVPCPCDERDAGCDCLANKVEAEETDKITCGCCQETSCYCAKACPDRQVEFQSATSTSKCGGDVSCGKVKKLTLASEARDTTVLKPVRQ